MPTEPIVRYVEQLLYPIVLGISGFTIACCQISCVVAKKHERIRAGLRWSELRTPRRRIRSA